MQIARTVNCDCESVMKLFFGSGTSQQVFITADVREYLPEDRKYQYQDGYSMAEAAKSWVSAEGYLPKIIATIVGNKELDSAHFEFPTKVWGGGTAMTDVMAFLPNGVIAVEAKVNEPFDNLVSVWIDIKKKDNPNSPDHRKAVIRQYAKAFGVAYESLLDIRYQLLQRTLCAAITANDKGVSKAWMIVQHFGIGNGVGDPTNLSDFNRFVALVGSAPVIEGVRVQVAWAEDSACDRW
jgi:hypothetical protein